MGKTIFQKQAKKEYMEEAIIPGVIWISVSYVVAIILQINAQFSLAHTMIFTVLILPFCYLYYFSPQLLQKNDAFYFTIQGILVYTSSFFMHELYVSIVSLFPLLLGQVLGLMKRNKWFYFILICALFLLAAFLNVPSYLWFVFFSASIPLTFMIVGSVLNFYRLIKSKNRTEKFLEELEVAYQKVKELTVQAERQRMARDLHDTLAQGLSSVKMQAEAINAQLNKKNYERAQQITKMAMKQSSIVLKEARLVIDDLRMTTKDFNLQDFIQEKVAQFSTSTGIPVDVIYDVPEVIEPKILEHCERMISEGLMNITRYAQANHVKITCVVQNNQQLFLKIQDDGLGFDIETVFDKPGHYGLLGIKERVRILGGTTLIQSKKGEGTTIQVSIPLKEYSKYEENFNR